MVNINARINWKPGMELTAQTFLDMDANLDFRQQVAIRAALGDRCMGLLPETTFDCSVGIAASIAMSAPRSERYFLKVQGAIKEMDVVLYKWLRNDPNRVVTIGKSVDCSLQLSWDINGYVAPKHAEICLKDQTPYLTALEEGIFLEGEALISGQTVRLYHGKSFTIGNTTFTYIEKDM